MFLVTCKHFHVKLITAIVIFLSFMSEAHSQNLPGVTGVFFENKSSEKLIVSMMYTFVDRDGYFYYRLYPVGKKGYVGPGDKIRMNNATFDRTRRYYVIISRQGVVQKAPNWGYVGWENDVRGAKVDKAHVPSGLRLTGPGGFKNKYVAVQAGIGNFAPLKAAANAKEGRPILATRIEPLGNFQLVKINYSGNGNGSIEVK